MAATAEALLAAAPARFTLVGLSLGGYVAFEVLRRQPDRVQRKVTKRQRPSLDSVQRRPT